MDVVMKKSLLIRAASVIMAVLVTISMIPVLGAGSVFANEQEADVTINGFDFHLWYSEEGASVALKGYSGTATQVVLPDSVSYEGTVYDAASGDGEANWFMLYAATFKGNTEITKIAIPNGYNSIEPEAFNGCISLSELAIGDSVSYISGDAFKGCPATTYYFKGENVSEESFKLSGIGTDADGEPIAGVTVFTKEGKAVWNAITALNDNRPEDKKIILQASDDPYSNHTIVPDGSDESSGGSSDSGTSPDSGGGSSGSDTSGNGGSSADSGSGSEGGSSGADSNSSGSNSNDSAVAPGSDGAPADSSDQSDQSETKGEDGTAYGKGASESVVDAALTALKAEKDPAGTVFGLLQLKASKVKKTSITLKWKKVSGAKKYVIYGNKCSKKNKLVKLKTLKSASKVNCTFTKVNKKKVAKGTYYKFIVVALDKNNKVLSTSKMVHVATKGGKYCNDKKITTKAKKNKKTIKKGKKFKLAAKTTKEDKSKKTQNHRTVSYESSNKKIATVDAKGVIKGKKKGTCYVYAYAQNGLCAKVKVTVK